MFWCCLFIINTLLSKYNNVVKKYLKIIFENDKKFAKQQKQSEGYTGCYSDTEIQNLLQNINCVEMLLNFEQYAKNIINFAFMYYSLYTKQIVKPVSSEILNRRFNTHLCNKYKNIFSPQNSRKYKIHIKNDKLSSYTELNNQFAKLYIEYMDLNFNNKKYVFIFIRRLLKSIIYLQQCIQAIYKNNMYEQDNQDYITEYDLYNRYLKAQQLIKSPLGQYTNLNIPTIVPSYAQNSERRQLLLEKHQNKYNDLCKQQSLSQAELDLLNPYEDNYDYGPTLITEQEYLQRKRQTFLKKIQYQQRILNTR